MSSELYGVWLTISSVMMWLNFFDVGFTLGLKNKLAEAIAREDWQRGKALVSTTYYVLLLIFVPICVVLELIIPHIDWAGLLHVNARYGPDIIRAMHILAACVCLQMIVNVLSAVIAAYQKVALSGVFPVISNIISLFVILILTKCCPASLATLALALSITPILVMAIAAVVLFHRRFRAVAPGWRLFNKKYVADLFGLGARFFIIQIQLIVVFQCTNVLISNLSGPNEVTAYNIAYKYVSVASMVLSLIVGPMWPAFTDAYTRKDYPWMCRVYRQLRKFGLVVAAVIILMVAASPVVYYFWIGEKAEIPFAMTALIGLFMLVNSWNIIHTNLINGIGTIKLQTRVTIIGLLCHIPFSFFLGNWIGYYGVIVSMICINALYATVFTIQLNKIINQKATGIWIK